MSRIGERFNIISGVVTLENLAEDIITDAVAPTRIRFRQRLEMGAKSRQSEEPKVNQKVQDCRT